MKLIQLRNLETTIIKDKKLYCRFGKKVPTSIHNVSIIGLKDFNDVHGVFLGDPKTFTFDMIKETKKKTIFYSIRLLEVRVNRLLASKMKNGNIYL